MKVVAMVVLSSLTFLACSSDPDSTSPSAPSTITPAAPTRTIDGGGASMAVPLPSLPADARVSDGGGEPRDAAYWITWSTCGEGSQADVAEANGGAAAGWYLLDDLLVTPGFTLGEHDVSTCDEGVELLDAAGRAEADLVDRLAGQILTGQLNLSVGSESCDAVDAGLAVGSSLLQELAFAGPGQHEEASRDIREGVDEALLVLGAYNDGSLCT